MSEYRAGGHCSGLGSLLPCSSWLITSRLSSQWNGCLPRFVISHTHTAGPEQRERIKWTWRGITFYSSQKKLILIFRKYAINWYKWTFKTFNSEYFFFHFLFPEKWGQSLSKCWDHLFTFPLLQYWWWCICTLMWSHPSERLSDRWWFTEHGSWGQRTEGSLSL